MSSDDEKDEKAIEKEFEEKQVILYQEPTIWHKLSLFVLAMLGWSILWYFSPFLKPEDVWNIFNKTCCKEWHNLTSCFLQNNCEGLLTTFLKSSNFSNCCYWIADYGASPKNWQKMCLANCLLQ